MRNLIGNALLNMAAVIAAYVAGTTVHIDGFYMVTLVIFGWCIVLTSWALQLGTRPDERGILAKLEKEGSVTIEFGEDNKGKFAYRVTCSSGGFNRITVGKTLHEAASKCLKSIKDFTVEPAQQEEEDEN